MAHRCIKPLCPADCSMCNHAVPEDADVLALSQRCSLEADLCRNEGADDIATLLQEASSVLHATNTETVALRSENERLKEERDEARESEHQVCEQSKAREVEFAELLADNERLKAQAQPAEALDDRHDFDEPHAQEWYTKPVQQCRKCGVIRMRPRARAAFHYYGREHMGTGHFRCPAPFAACGTSPDIATTSAPPQAQAAQAQPAEALKLAAERAIEHALNHAGVSSSLGYELAKSAGVELFEKFALAATSTPPQPVAEVDALPEHHQNTLESCANWLESRSRCVTLRIKADPDEGGGYENLMRRYAEDLRAIRAALATRAKAPSAVPEGRGLIDLFQDALASVEDYRGGREFGSCDRKLIGRLKSAIRDAATIPAPSSAKAEAPTDLAVRGSREGAQRHPG